MVARLTTIEVDQEVLGSSPSKIVLFAVMLVPDGFPLLLPSEN